MKKCHIDRKIKSSYCPIWKGEYRAKWGCCLLVCGWFFARVPHEISFKDLVANCTFVRFQNGKPHLFVILYFGDAYELWEWDSYPHSQCANLRHEQYKHNQPVSGACFFPFSFTINNYISSSFFSHLLNVNFHIVGVEQSCWCSLQLQNQWWTGILNLFLARVRNCSSSPYIDVEFH
jgi:hypothetical protein